MAAKRDNNRVLSMLERMGMIQKIDKPQPPGDFASPAPRPDAPAPAPAPPAAWTKAPVQTDFSAQPNSPPQQTAASGYANREMISMTTDSYGDSFAPEPTSYEPYSGQMSDPRETGVRQPPADESFWDNAGSAQPDMDRFMEIGELYHALGMKTAGTDTVYLVEEYLKTLPESLPAEARRSIILKLVSTSGFDFDRLLSDGIDRVARLNEYASSFSAHTDELVTRCNAELETLQQQMERVRGMINERKNLHKRQFLAIENEAQRLRDVLDFITK